MRNLWEKLKNTCYQFLKFGFVGVINTVLSYLISNGCYYALHLHEQISNFISFIITVFISFVLNSRFVFQDEGRLQEKECPWDEGQPQEKECPRDEGRLQEKECPQDEEQVRKKELPKDEAQGKKQPWYKALLKVYASYALTELVLMGVLLFIEERIIGIPHFIATLVNLCVTVPLNFLLNKFWAYR